jgi:FtsZ-binding cell division protein ZapB
MFAKATDFFAGSKVPPARAQYDSRRNRGDSDVDIHRMSQPVSVRYSHSEPGGFYLTDEMQGEITERGVTAGRDIQESTVPTSYSGDHLALPASSHQTGEATRRDTKRRPVEAGLLAKREETSLKEEIRALEKDKRELMADMERIRRDRASLAEENRRYMGKIEELYGRVERQNQEL